MINIDRKTKIAVISNISYYRKCTYPDLLYKKGGSTILNFLLGFLELNKKELDIKRLVLTDNSYKACKNCKNDIRLGDMYQLIYGNTWYGSKGFRPYISIQNKPDLARLKQYENNQLIIKKALVKDVPLFQYLMEAVNELKIKNIDSKGIEQIFIQWKDKSLSLTGLLR